MARLSLVRQGYDWSAPGRPEPLRGGGTNFERSPDRWFRLRKICGSSQFRPTSAVFTATTWPLPRPILTTGARSYCTAGEGGNEKSGSGFTSRSVCTAESCFQVNSLPCHSTAARPSTATPRWDQHQTWYVETSPVISVLTHLTLNVLSVRSREKPRSDGSRVCFGYEGKALVSQDQGFCSRTSGASNDTTGLFNQLLLDGCQYPRMGVSGFSYR